MPNISHTIYPEGWNPDSSKDFNRCMLDIKKDLLPKGVRKRKRVVKEIPFSQNKLRVVS